MDKLTGSIIEIAKRTQRGASIEVPEEWIGRFVWLLVLPRPPESSEGRERHA